MRAALQTISFTDEAATYIVDSQGFDQLEDHAILTKEEASNICKVTRHPGGLQDNGNPNPGIAVSLRLRTT